MGAVGNSFCLSFEGTNEEAVEGNFTNNIPTNGEINKKKQETNSTAMKSSNNESKIQKSTNDSVIIQDSFYNKKDDKDPIYNQLKIEEKKSLIKIFSDNKANIENIILNDNQFYYVQNISQEIIQRIPLNEDSHNFIKNKILKKIDSIANDDGKYKIDNLTILVIGRKGIGKTTLIKYILELSNNNIINNNDIFREFTSQKIKFLKLIEIKGIGYSQGATIQNIKDYIDSLISSNNNNYNNVIHCIWYCISDTRFIKEERVLYNSLKELYQDNIIPIIFIYTMDSGDGNADRMETYLREKCNIYNSFVKVVAEDMSLMGNKTIKAFGKNELIQTTLEKCTEALGSSMLKIMIQLILKNIKEDAIKETEKNKNKIINDKNQDFLGNYKSFKEDEEFISYIANIFYGYLDYFYDKEKSITNKTKNLIRKSDFISQIKNIYSYYQSKVNEIIKPITQEKSKDFIDFQATFEKNNGNMNQLNRRNHEEFTKTSEIFLKKQYYFIIQKHIINMILNPSNKNQYNSYFNNFINSISQQLSNIINSIGNLNDNNEDDILLKDHLKFCFKRKLYSFCMKNNISFCEIDKTPPKLNLYQNNKTDTEPLELIIENSHKLIFERINRVSFNLIERTNYHKNWFKLQYNNWKYLNENFRNELKIFLEKINYQESSINMENEDKTFIFLQNQIKNDLINFFNINIGQYFNTIYSSYQNIPYNYSNDEIDLMSNNEYLDLFYKNKIHDTLSLYAQEQNQFLLNYIAIAITGKAGVGKSTLINCLLKDMVTEEGFGEVTTQELTKNCISKKIPFLKLIDTRGYELNQKYNPETIKDIVLNFIASQNSQNNINDFIQCILYCLNCNEIDQNEINALKGLKNNCNNIPLIIVFSNAQKKPIVENIRKQIKNLFPDTRFIPVLARETKIMDKYGLDKLLNLILDSIKTTKKSDLLNIVINTYKEKEQKYVNEMIGKIVIHIINQLVKEFITNYKLILNQEDFENYIYNLIEIIIKTFGFKEQISKKTKLLIRNDKNNIKKFIQSYIQFYTENAQNYINPILEYKSFEYLEMQVNIEKKFKSSIGSEDKRNKKDFKNLISKFLKDNFHFVAQKYLIFILLRDVIEDLSEKLYSNITLKLENFLQSKDVQDDYRNIYSQ